MHKKSRTKNTKKYRLKALMVTYHGNNYMEEGERNLYRMKDEFEFEKEQAVSDTNESEAL